MYLEGRMLMHDLHALVVDDSKVGRLTMMKKLEGMGMKVELAESGQQALDQLARWRPDIIFMDHMMPEMDGFEVTRRIKSDPAIRDIPVVIISGNDEAEFVAEARAVGALDAIAKPPATEVLDALLASLAKVSEQAPMPVASAPAPAPALDMAELQALVERLLGTAISPLRNEFMVGIKLGAAATESLGSRMQSVEERLLPLETETGRPQADFETLQAEMDQRVDQRVDQRIEQRIAAGLSGLQTRIDGLMPQLEGLQQTIQATQADAAQHASDADHKAAGWNTRLDAFAADLTRVSLDLESVRKAQAENLQRIEQHTEQRLAQVQEVLSLPHPVSVPEPERVAEIQAMQAEMDALRERLNDSISESRLRQFVTEALASHAPAAEATPDFVEALPEAASENLKSELAQLRSKVKSLTVATAVGGALLLLAIGIALFGG
jgi:CheY-like chemotaxis protein